MRTPSIHDDSLNHDEAVSWSIFEHSLKDKVKQIHDKTRASLPTMADDDDDINKLLEDADQHFSRTYYKERLASVTVGGGHGVAANKKPLPAPKSAMRRINPELAKAKAGKLKDEGTAFMKKKMYAQAVRFYTKSLQYQYLAPTLSNRAMAFLKQKKFAEAERDCTKTLEFVDASNKIAYEGEEKSLRALRVKTFFRRGMARQAMGWYEQALGDFDSALVLEAQNQRAKTARQNLARALGSLPARGRTLTTPQLSEMFKREIIFFYSYVEKWLRGDVRKVQTSFREGVKLLASSFTNVDVSGHIRTYKDYADSLFGAYGRRSRLRLDVTNIKLNIECKGSCVVTFRELEQEDGRNTATQTCFVLNLRQPAVAEDAEEEAPYYNPKTDSFAAVFSQQTHVFDPKETRTA